MKEVNYCFGKMIRLNNTKILPPVIKIFVLIRKKINVGKTMEEGNAYTIKRRQTMMSTINDAEYVL